MAEGHLAHRLVSHIFMKNRYVIKTDNKTESFKIVDTGTLLGTEDQDHELIARVYDREYAERICSMLNRPTDNLNGCSTCGGHGTLCETNETGFVICEETCPICGGTKNAI